MQEAGKGDQRRPTDNEAYSTNYDAIFGTKIRGTNYNLVILDELAEENTGVSPSLAQGNGL